MILMCVLATIRRKSGPQPHAGAGSGVFVISEKRYISNQSNGGQLS